MKTFMGFVLSAVVLLTGMQLAYSASSTQQFTVSVPKRVLSPVENGGAGRSKMAALGFERDQRVRLLCEPGIGIGTEPEET